MQWQHKEKQRKDHRKPTKNTSEATYEAIQILEERGG